MIKILHVHLCTGLSACFDFLFLNQVQKIAWQTYYWQGSILRRDLHT